MRRFFLTFLSIAALSSATAAQAPVRTDGVPPTGLTIGDCLTILTGLNKLDEQRDVVVNKGKPNEAVVKEYYEFGKVGLRMDIAHNIRLLTDVQRDSQPEQQRIFYRILRTVPDVKVPRPGEQAGPATTIPQGSPQEEEFQAKMRELTDKPCLAQIVRINAADLNVDPNRIPVGTLSLIDKILDR